MGDTPGLNREKRDFMREAICKEIQIEHLFATRQRNAHSSIEPIFSRCIGSAVAC